MSPRKVDSDVLDGSDGPGGDTVAGETLPANDLHRPKVEMQDDMNGFARGETFQIIDFGPPLGSSFWWRQRRRRKRWLGSI